MTEAGLMQIQKKQKLNEVHVLTVLNFLKRPQKIDFPLFERIMYIVRNSDISDLKTVVCLAFDENMSYSIRIDQLKPALEVLGILPTDEECATLAQELADLEGGKEFSFEMFCKIVDEINS